MWDWIRWAVVVALLLWLALERSGPATATTGIPDVRCVQGRAFVADRASPSGWSEIAPEAVDGGR